MRVGGRLQQTGWPFHRQHPILLPKSYLVELFVRQQHIERKHQGVEATVAFLRQKFWIISARRIIRKVKEGCVVCRRFDANTCEEVVAPLPESRVDHQYPFCVCGLDYAGPLAARTQGDVCKVWIALFSCATTRAVHLEIVTGLSVDEFLLAFRRFVSRRARPRRMISDNAPTFRAAAGIVDIDWSFNLPGSPWFGGFYERLVSSVKAPLRKVLGQALLHLQELYTVLPEIEALINSRPLTHEGDHVDQPAITPALLMGQVWQDSSSKSASMHAELGKSAMIKRAKHVNEVTQHLKTRWQEEYIAQLRLFNWPTRAAPTTVQVGELVYVGTD